MKTACTVESSRAAIAALMGKVVSIEVSQENVAGKMTTRVVIRGTKTRPVRYFSFYAEADPHCYSDLSDAAPMSADGFTLSEGTVVSERGIKLVFEDQKTGAERQLRVIVSDRDGCKSLVCFDHGVEGTIVQAAA